MFFALDRYIIHQFSNAEVFNAIGGSLTEIAVPISAIETLRSDEILAVRTLAKVS